MKTYRFLASLAAPLLVLAPTGPSPALGQSAPAECPDPGALTAGFEGPMAHVRYLADDALEGREVASAGERCAAAYIVDQFEAMGLLPAGDHHTFYQSWDVRVGSQLASGNQFTIEQGAESLELALGEAWIPFGYSGPGPVDGRATAMPEGQGAGQPHTLDGVVLLLEGTSDPHRAASEAARLGAAAVVVLLGEGDALPALDSERRAALGIPVVAVTTAGAEALRSAAENQGTARISASVEPLMKTARNVAAIIPGTSDQGTVIVGAHYDHLGRGGEGSLSPNDFGTIHNGADDNASGTAALIEVAERLAAGPPPAQSVLFLAFSGEERGLWGSAQYVQAPLLPLESTLAMLNMDMVGRVTADKLTVFGTGTAEEWEQLLAHANQGPLELQLVADGYGSSDHSSFYAQGIPVLHFFSGTHAEYHRTQDDWELINEQGLKDVTNLVGRVAEALAGPGDRVALTAVEGAGNPHAAPGGDAADAPARSDFSVRLGTIPNYSQEEGGMRISGVRDDSPAAKAGIQGGDVIVRFGERPVEDVYGYMYALQDHQPGDVVEIEVLRGEERLVITVTLEGGAG
ncbi:MAG: M28 family peptidase [Longimicrobiales bacterium]